MGSTPAGRAISNILREVAQLGRALGLGPRGRRFESCLPDQLFIWGLSSAGRAPALHAGGQRFDPARLHQIFKYKDLGGVAQLARAFGSYPKGRGFDSLCRYLKGPLAQLVRADGS